MSLQTDPVEENDQRPTCQSSFGNLCNLISSLKLLHDTRVFIENAAGILNFNINPLATIPTQSRRLCGYPSIFYMIVLKNIKNDTLLFPGYQHIIVVQSLMLSPSKFPQHDW
jgi:hypothetical protein